MPISYVAAGSVASNGGGADLAPGIPAGMERGDVMLCCVYSREGADGSFVAPPGWAKAVESFPGEPGCLAVYWRAWVSGDAAPTVELVSHTGGAFGDAASAVVLGFRGVDTSSPVRDVGEVGAGSDAAIGPIPGITLKSVPSATVLVVGGKSSADSPMSTLVGDSLTWVEAVDVQNTEGADATLIAQYAISDAGGVAVTPKTSTGGIELGAWKGVMLELRPGSDTRIHRPTTAPVVAAAIGARASLGRMGR
jgi:hypothetical protein